MSVSCTISHSTFLLTLRIRKAPSTISIEAVTGAARKQYLFTQIVKKDTRDVAIGPLEYCGTGRMIKVGKGQLYVISPKSCVHDNAQSDNPRLSACWEDHSLPAAVVAREYRGLNRRLKGLEKVGEAKKAMKLTAKRKLQKEVDALTFDLRSEKPTNDDDEDRKIKRPRISEEKKMVKAMNGILSPRRTRVRKGV